MSASSKPEGFNNCQCVLMCINAHLKFALSEIPKFFTATDAHIPSFITVNNMYIWVFRMMSKQALDTDD